jgi:hypothetical protein
MTGSQCGWLLLLCPCVILSFTTLCRLPDDFATRKFARTVLGKIDSHSQNRTYGPPRLKRDPGVTSGETSAALGNFPNPSQVNRPLDWGCRWFRHCRNQMCRHDRHSPIKSLGQFLLWLSCSVRWHQICKVVMAKREIISRIQVPKAWAREANQWRLYRTHTARPPS